MGIEEKTNNLIEGLDWEVIRTFYTLKRANSLFPQERVNINELKSLLKPFIVRFLENEDMTEAVMSNFRITRNKTNNENEKPGEIIRMGFELTYSLDIFNNQELLEVMRNIKI